MITRPGYTTANGTPPARAVRAVIEEHMEGLGRLNRLRAYYDGRHPISRPASAKAGCPTRGWSTAFRVTLPPRPRVT